MITSSKLDEYQQYRGYYEGFYIQKVKNGTNVTSNDEWFLIESFIQDIRLVEKGLASKDFAETLEKMLKESCDSEDTIEKLKEVAMQVW